MAIAFLTVFSGMAAALEPPARTVDIPTRFDNKGYKVYTPPAIEIAVHESKGQTARTDGNGFCSKACACGCVDGRPCDCAAPTKREMPPAVQKSYYQPLATFRRGTSSCVGGSCR